MNKEIHNLLKITFTYEYYKDNITERYMRDLSRNVILDNDCLDIEYLEKIYVIPYKKYNQVKKQVEEKNKPQIFIDTQDIEERYAEGLYQDYLEEENKKYKNQQKEFIEYLENEKDRCLTFYSSTACMYAYDVFKDVLSKYYEIIEK